MTGPLFTAVQAVAQTGLATGVFTMLTFPTEIEDSHSGHSTSTNTSRFTCPTSWAGCYWVSGTAHIVGTGGKRGLAVFKNGAMVAGSLAMVAAAPTFDTAVHTGWTVRLAVSDYVELGAFHDAGVSRDTYADPPTGYGSGINVEYRRA
jgi:hypothetical protein